MAAVKYEREGLIDINALAAAVGKRLKTPVAVESTVADNLTLVIAMGLEELGLPRDVLLSSAKFTEERENGGPTQCPLRAVSHCPLSR